MKIKDFNHYSGKRYDGMMGRCYRETDKSYPRYGLRGIRVCKDWILDITSFRTWLLAEISRCGITVEDFVSKSNHYQLDRINPDGHYTPQNCRLTTRQTNSRNKRGLKDLIISAENDIIYLKSDEQPLLEKSNNEDKLKLLLS